MRFRTSVAILLPLLGLVAGLSSADTPAPAVKPAAKTEVKNPYAPAYGHSYRHGAVPTREAHDRMKAWIATSPQLTTLTTGTETLSYGGGIDGIGVTSGQPKVYLVVYGTQWGSSGTDANGNLTVSGDTYGAVPYLQKLFKGLGTGNELWSGTMTQYCDGPLVSTGATSCPSGAPHIGYPTGGTAFAGIWYDNSGASPSSATAAQLAQEAIKAAAHFGNTTAASNRYAQYVILSPSGTTPDGFNTSSGNFCAWHDYNTDAGVSSPYGDIAFTNMPYVADAGSSCGAGSVTSSNLDGFSIVEGHEYAETITDQNPAGGWTNTTGSSYNGQEDGDECAWISSGQGATQSVAMGTGSFPMQSTWSNDTNQCEIAHPIVGGTGGTPNCNSGIADGSALSCSAAGLPGYTGTAYTRVYTTYTGGGACTQVAAPGYDTSGCTAPSNSLSNGVPVTGLTLATNAQKVYTFAVPSGATSANFQTSGGSGDVDLYVQLGSAPTTTTYLAKSDGPTTAENITLSSPTAGTYYVLLNGYNAPTGFQVVASYSTSSGGGNVLSNGVPKPNLSGATGSKSYYTFTVPSGRSSLTIKTSGGSGDSDLYVQIGQNPTTSSYLKRSVVNGNNDSITISNPQAGTYYIMLYGYAAYSGLSLVASD